MGHLHKFKLLQTVKAKARDAAAAATVEAPISVKAVAARPAKRKPTKTAARRTTGKKNAKKKRA